MDQFSYTFRFIVLFICLLRPISTLNGKEVYFENLNLQDGLPNNSVKAVLQDEMGFIWLGTINGLFRYDGYEFRAIGGWYENKQVSNFSVLDLKQDLRGRIWIASNNKGVYCYDIYSERFVSFENELPIKRSQVNSLEIIGDSILLLGTVNGLIKVKSSGGRFEEYDELIIEKSYPDSLNLQQNKNYITSIKLVENDGDPFCWIGTNAQLFKYLIRENSFSVIESSRGSIRDIAPAQNGQTLIAYWNAGIELIDAQSNHINSEQIEEINSIIGKYRIMSILHETETVYWIGTYQHGLYKFDFASGEMDVSHYTHTPSVQNTIGSNAISCIMQDNLGIIWLGHDIGGGITKIYSEKNNMEFLTNIFLDKSTYSYTITSLTSTPSSTLWIGTLGKGIACYNFDRDCQFHLSSSASSPIDIETDYIQSLDVDQWGNLWLGTSGKGVKVIPHFTVNEIRQERPVSDRSVYTIDRDAYPFINNYIYDMLFDGDGNLWLATHQGLYYAHIPNSLNSKQAFQQFHENLEIKNVFEDVESLEKMKINSIHQDVDGNILVCSENSGIISIKLLSEGRFLHDIYKHIPYRENTISSNKAFSGCFDKAGNFWSTTSNGLDRIELNSRTVTRVLSNNDIGNFQMLNATFDSKGNLWLALNYGILRYDTLNQEIKKFYRTNAADNYFSGGASHMDLEGVLYLGSRYSIAYFKPEFVIDSTYNSPLYVTDFKINNTRIIPGKKLHGRVVIESNINDLTSLTLRSRDINISFDLASLDYNNKHAIQYRYKLEGSQNNDWIIMNQGHRTISFSNLNPGSYRLIISNTNSLGVWNTENRILNCRVLPPPWKSIPAIFSYVALVLLLLYLSQRMWLIRQKEKSVIRFAQLEKQQSEKLHNLKLQFFMNISHEFRTPLSLIIAPLEMLKNKLSGSEERHQLQLITRNANRLLYLINQIIDIRKADKGKLNIKYVKINITLFAENLLQIFSLTAYKKNINLLIDSADQKLMIQMDPHQMETVFYNLLSNAIRYTPDDGKIEISIRRKEDHCSISIADTGAGIDPLQMPHIFERFHFSPDPGGGSVGAGIGLSHTKSIIELHQGEIEVNSSKGEGTEFIITLPLKAPGKEQKEIPEITVGEFFSQVQAVIQQEYTDIEAGDVVKERVSAVHKPSYSIVIAEDNEDLRTYLFNYLSDRFEKVEAASNGEQALELIREMNPDLLISDVMMPRIDGLELTRIIKEDDTLKNTFIILITAKNFEQDRINAIQAGVDVYIFKPFKMQYLMLRIEKLFERKDNVEKQISEGVFTLLKGEKVLNSEKLFIDRAIGIVEENIENPDFKIDGMYRELNVSRAQLYRKIGRLTGFAVKEFIREIRLQRAAQILREDNLTVNEVSYMVGFGSPTYFSICFKKKFGSSPLQYKSENYIKPSISISK